MFFVGCFGLTSVNFPDFWLEFGIFVLFVLGLPICYLSLVWVFSCVVFA